MILDQLNNIKRYEGLGENFKKAIDFVTNTDLYSLEPGDVDIAGKEVFAFVKDNVLDKENPRYEIHKKYSDIQIILGGSERIGYEDTARLNLTEAYNETSDLEFYKGGPDTELFLHKGDFAIFMPGEAHCPDCPGESNQLRRKMVIKVRTR
ncbi:MAG: YhcH/YjgK/YiaL family protein [Candidatus Limivicinus sp.]|jgi:biofilm protein TabA